MNADVLVKPVFVWATAHAAVRYRRILGTAERESSSFLLTRDTRQIRAHSRENPHNDGPGQSDSRLTKKFPYTVFHLRAAAFVNGGEVARLGTIELR